MIEEKRLIRKLRQQDEQALETLIRTYTPYLSTVIYRAAGNGLTREDTEEIISDAFVSLWQNAERLDPEKGTIRSYLAGTVRNLAYKHLRDRSSELSLDELGTEISGTLVTATPDETLWQAVAELGEEDCEIFIRFYRYRETLKDISKAMNMKVPTVKTRLSRGKAKLRKILTEEGQ